MSIDVALSAIERARPFIDADWEGSGWKPSELMTIGYCLLASGPHPERAEDFLNDLVGEARNRYAAGFYANPFREPPGVRARPAGSAVMAEMPSATRIG